MAPNSPIYIQQITPETIRRYLAEFISIAKDQVYGYWTEENFLRDLPDKWVLSLAVIENHVPIAYAFSSRKSHQVAHLHHFMVAKNSRNKGVGRRLLAEVEKLFVEHGYATITLKAPTLNEGAVRFYTRMGYRERHKTGTQILFEKNLIAPSEKQDATD